jgi:hypothetical protein
MDEVKTGVDELMQLLATHPRLSLAEAAKYLKQPEAVVQNWVDFLVEERLLGIEYKFTTPYIYLNRPAMATSAGAAEETIEDVAHEFLRRAKEKGIPAEKYKQLWENHLLQSVESRAEFFRQECQKRRLPNVTELFTRYKEKVIKEHEL